MQSENVATLTEIRRHFHTLKGSGRMIGAKSSAELAWTVEDTLNPVINQSLGLTLTSNNMFGWYLSSISLS